MYNQSILIGCLCDGDLILSTGKNWVRDYFTIEELLKMGEIYNG